MSQHQAASGQFDRAVSPADRVGSLKQGPHVRPTRTVARGITVPTGTANMEIPVAGPVLEHLCQVVLARGGLR